MCFAALRQLRSIRRSVSDDVLQSLVMAQVFSRLDYGSATLVGIPKQLIDRLQSVNAAARLIFRARRYDHVQPLLRSLHWLRVPERISFRLAVLVYRCLHDSAPGYLASDLQRVSDLRRRLRQRSSPHVRACYHRRPSLPGCCCICLETVRSSPSLPVFRRSLKTKLFVRSYSCSAS